MEVYVTVFISANVKVTTFFFLQTSHLCVLCFQNALWDTLVLTVNTNASVRTVAFVTERVAGAPVQQAGWAHAVRRVKNIIVPHCDLIIILAEKNDHREDDIFTRYTFIPILCVLISMYSRFIWSRL